MNVEWLPIESAPRDGSHILLFDGRFVFEGLWVQNDVIFKDASGWYDVWGSEYAGTRANPSDCKLWMRMPPPPGEEVAVTHVD
jgi:hypothetical protein